MEYKIYNESLVYYALRDPIGGTYLHYGAFTGAAGVGIEASDKFDTRKEAEDARRRYSKENEKLKDLQIRKVKVIDIGEV